jgi:hypothetical protein
MQCKIELAAGGELLLTTPDGREILLQPIPTALALLQRVLYHAEQHASPLAFPTQHVINAWNKGRQIDWSAQEPAVKRRVIGDAPRSTRKAKPTLKAFGHEKKLGPDLSLIEFEL